MGKNNRHSKDRMYQSSSELQSHKRPEGGGAGAGVGGGHLPFDHCAISMTPYETPCCTPEGVVFELTNLVPYLQKHKKNPITGSAMTSRDIIRLTMSKNADGEWQCPVTFKVFNDASHVVAVRTTGSVYSYDAVLELNIRAKNWEDLLTGEAFDKSDIITLFDGQNVAHMRSRDLTTFAHLRQVREETQAALSGDHASRVRHNPTAENVMKELKRLQEEKDKEVASDGGSSSIFSGTVGALAQARAHDSGEDVADLLALQLTTEEANPGANLTTGDKSGSFTSTSFGSIVTSNATRLASAPELRDARFRHMRALGKKAFVQLQTSQGQINLEVHCDLAPRTSWNFLTLCERGYYDGKSFHRLVPGFTLQGGAETAAGKGGASAFPGGRVFADEFDPRLKHDARGVVSMANAGPNCNKSQFFITLGADCSHLDRKHSVFGRVVGGAATIDRIEAAGADKGERPLAEVVIVRALVFGSPVAEADALLRAEAEARRGKAGAGAGAGGGGGAAVAAAASGPVVGKYISAQPPSHSSSSSSSSALGLLGGYGQEGSEDEGEGGAGAGAEAEAEAEAGQAAKRARTAPPSAAASAAAAGGGFGDFSGW